MTSAEREARILSLAPLVKMIAVKKAAVMISVGLDELTSAAWMGAINAVDHFDPARNVRLADFARWRISGAIGDYLRSIDPLGRHHRARVKRGEELSPIAFSIDAPSIEDEETSSRHQVIPDPHAGREQNRQEARLTLIPIYRRACLRPRNAKVLKRYMEGELLSDIAKSIGVKESRASQICKESIRKLRAAA